jgi:hypothetical protein
VEVGLPGLSLLEVVIKPIMVCPLHQTQLVAEEEVAEAKEVQMAMEATASFSLPMEEAVLTATVLHQGTRVAVAKQVFQMVGQQAIVMIFLQPRADLALVVGRQAYNPAEVAVDMPEVVVVVDLMVLVEAGVVPVSVHGVLTHRLYLTVSRAMDKLVTCAFSAL